MDRKNKSGLFIMLIGEYEYKMDAKKRLPMPARLREQLGLRVVGTRGLEGCLFVYPTSTWSEVAQKLMQAPQGQAASRRFTRLLLSGASEMDLDGLGRILIPENLKSYAELEKNVMVVGAGNRLEIWSKEKWEHYKNRTEKEVGEMAEKLGELGLY